MVRKNTQTYENAMQQLETLVQQIEKNELGIDQLAEKLKEANALIQFCKEKLYNTDQEIRKILESAEK